MAARVADDAHRRAVAARYAVVVAAVHMAVDPQIGAWQQIVVGVAKTRGAGLVAEARIAAAQARPVVGDDDGRVPAVVGARKLGGEPGAASQRLFANAAGVERQAVTRGTHDLHEVGGRAPDPIAVARTEQIEVAPANRRDEANSPAV